MKIAIVISDFYKDLSNNLLDGAKNKYNQLTNFSFEENVNVYRVPGAFEICGAVKQILYSNASYDAVITYGCIIKGETAHFEYICNSVSNGIKDLSISKKTKIPILFGVLTAFSFEQALKRSDPNDMDKGGEVMSAALETIETFKLINN
tara:strand:+ start:503 stop:949 length:447 start_codon:yes stop_codon:yes gene_type:complete